MSGAEIPLDIPVYLEWRDADDRLQRQRVAWSMFVVGVRGQVQTVTIGLPEVGDLVVIDSSRQEPGGRWVAAQLCLLVTSRPRWTLREYPPAPDRLQMLRECVLRCVAADDELS